MPDWPGVPFTYPRTALSTFGTAAATGQIAAAAGARFNNSGTWPAANRALYIPVVLEQRSTVYKMSFGVATQSGNYDVGIYDVTGARIVSLGSTAVPAAGLATADIADTVLVPGVYFLAMNVDNITASFNRLALALPVCRSSGVQQQAVGAVTLPATWTPANPATAYVPALTAHLVATI